MKLNEIYSGKFLKCEDLGGRRRTVTILGVKPEKFDEGNKLVVSFLNQDKAMVCNKTNANKIAEVLGTDETDDWVGKKIVLYPAQVDFAGKMSAAIRVDFPGQPAAAPARPAAPPPPPARAQDLDEEDSPF